MTGVIKKVKLFYLFEKNFLSKQINFKRFFLLHIVEILIILVWKRVVGRVEGARHPPRLPDVRTLFPKRPDATQLSANQRSRTQ